MQTHREYEAPIADIRFALEELADLGALSKLPEFAHSDQKTVAQMLRECGRFVREVLTPIDRSGDLEGCRFDPSTGAVETPPGWADAYAAYMDAGWNSAPFPAEYGGAEFPWLVGVALGEMVTSASMSFSLCPMLTQGVAHMLLYHGSDEQRDLYVPKMVSGEWTGTMVLTEPQAGSDLGALTTRAVPGGDGSWRISGQKMFITYGEHDLAENIVHLVLARVPDAPSGTGGISCFIVPKFVPDEHGEPGDRNSVKCRSIEHKLGIHGSPTCVIAFDEAVGYLIGEENAGMRYMFTVMNTSRLAIGLEGLAQAETSYQQAWAYASTRVQGQPVMSHTGDSGTIIDHPDVRRMLLTMRSLIEAMRGLIYINAQAIDLAQHAETETERFASQELCDLLTPVSKAWCTETGAHVVDLALQVHGGLGYIEETGIAQRYRDVRIASIYEGTNGIQAIDLVGRKIGMRGGSAVKDLFHQIERLDDELGSAGPSVASIYVGLREALAALRETTAWMLDQLSKDRAAALAGATPYLQQWGLVLGGWVLARQALAAVHRADTDEFYLAKLTTASFYAEQLLPRVGGLSSAVSAGADRFYRLTGANLASR
jgi:alkylation response protein AidB-like acyl-CoA dehydrogenase